MAYEDEFNATVIVLADGLVAMHHKDDRFNIVQVDPKPSDDALPSIIGFDREAAERLAVWLRCRLDQPRTATQVTTQAPRPAGIVKTPDLTPAQRRERREGEWFLRAHHSAIPSDLRSDDCLARWIERQGITYRYRGTSTGKLAVVFRGCRNVPGYLPEWLSAYSASEDAAALL